MIELNRLSTSSRDLLMEIAGTDGNKGDLSALDLTQAADGKLAELMVAIGKDGYNLTEQELVREVLRLTSDKGIDSKGQQFLSYDFASGDVTALPFSDRAAAKAPRLRTTATVRDLVLNSRTVEKRAALHKNTYDSAYLNRNSRIDGALKARDQLASAFAFSPKDPYDLAALKTFAATLSRDQIPQFMDLYLTAHFEHPGKGSAWTAGASWAGVTEAVLFGSPSHLDELPDGRRLMDCQGFAAAAVILTETLYGAQPGDKAICKPICYPAHEMALLKDGDKVFIVDNNKVTELKLKPDEIKLLSLPIADWNLDELTMSRESLPTLYEYVDKHHPSIKGRLLEFDDGDALNDG